MDNRLIFLYFLPAFERVGDRRLDGSANPYSYGTSKPDGLLQANPELQGPRGECGAQAHK